MITLNHYLFLSALLFAIGFLGVMTRRNILIIYMCLELMLSAANLTLVAFGKFQSTHGVALDAQVLLFFILTVAAAEVAVGLALIVALYRARQTTNVEDLVAMKH